MAVSFLLYFRDRIVCYEKKKLFLVLKHYIFFINKHFPYNC